jgi:peptidoglycan hydrolase-like protein with peptidoglycan-binding domain
VYEYERGEARKFAQRVASAFTTGLGVAALLVAVATAPAEAKKKPKPIEKSTEAILDPANGEPLTLVISLGDQKIDVYRGLTLITSSKVSTGTPDYPTKAGVFSILEKRRYHHSNMYSAAPMPWMQRLTWSGTALHGGVVPGYPASHGCIRLRFSFAPKLFQITTGGENVIIARDRPAPRLVDHPTLFQPSGLSDEKQEEEVAPSNNAIDANPPDRMSPSVLTNEGDPAPWLASEATTQSLPGQAEAIADMAEDHALDPTVDPSGELSSDGTNTHAVDDARSLAPLRILATRRTERDRIISVQYMLSSMGYLTPQKFSGRLGNATATAIKAFQKANGLPETGTYTDDLAKKVYQVGGKEEPPEGHLFVRQNFQPVFDTPIAFRNSEQTLGTHVFTAMFAAGEINAKWMALSLEGDDAVAALDRIEIPDNVRQKISEKLTPGSSLIIGDESRDSAVLPHGGDFIVMAKTTSAVAGKPKAKVKHARVGKPKAKPTKKGGRTVRGYAYNYSRDFDRPRQFYRWRWRR